MSAYVSALCPLCTKECEIICPDSNDQQTEDTFAWVSKIEVFNTWVPITVILLLEEKDY